MKNLFLGLGFFLVTIFAVSCTNTEIENISTDLTLAELEGIKIEVQNSDVYKVYKSTIDDHSEQLTAKKIDLMTIHSEIIEAGHTIDCEGLSNFETRATGYKLFYAFVCDFADAKTNLYLEFEILNELTLNQLEFVFGTKASSRFSCQDVYQIALEFYTLPDALWALDSCCGNAVGGVPEDDTDCV